MTVDGLSDLVEGFRELPKRTSKSVLRRVLTKRLEPAAEAMRRLAPDNPATGEGDLRSSIGVSTKLSKRQRQLHEKQHKDDVEVFVGAGPVPQAHLQEFGTVNHPPQSFARAGWDETKNGVLDGIADDLRDEIEKSAKRIAARQKRARG